MTPKQKARSLDRSSTNSSENIHPPAYVRSRSEPPQNRRISRSRTSTTFNGEDTDTEPPASNGLCGLPDFYSKLLGPTADETFLVGIKTLLTVGFGYNICGEPGDAVENTTTSATKSDTDTKPEESPTSHDLSTETSTTRISKQDQTTDSPNDENVEREDTSTTTESIGSSQPMRVTDYEKSGSTAKYRSKEDENQKSTITVQTNKSVHTPLETEEILTISSEERSQTEDYKNQKQENIEHYRRSSKSESHRSKESSVSIVEESGEKQHEQRKQLSESSRNHTLDVSDNKLVESQSESKHEISELYTHGEDESKHSGRLGKTESRKSESRSPINKQTSKSSAYFGRSESQSQRSQVSNRFKTVEPTYDYSRRFGISESQSTHSNLFESEESTPDQEEQSSENDNQNIFIKETSRVIKEQVEESSQTDKNHKKKIGKSKSVIKKVSTKSKLVKSRHGVARGASSMQNASKQSEINSSQELRDLNGSVLSEESGGTVVISVGSEKERRRSRDSNRSTLENKRDESKHDQEERPTGNIYSKESSKVIKEHIEETDNLESHNQNMNKSRLVVKSISTKLKTVKSRHADAFIQDQTSPSYVASKQSHIKSKQDLKDQNSSRANKDSCNTLVSSVGSDRRSQNSNGSNLIDKRDVSKYDQEEQSTGNIYSKESSKVTKERIEEIDNLGSHNQNMNKSRLVVKSVSTRLKTVNSKHSDEKDPSSIQDYTSPNYIASKQNQLKSTQDFKDQTDSRTNKDSRATLVISLGSDNRSKHSRDSNASNLIIEREESKSDQEELSSDSGNHITYTTESSKVIKERVEETDLGDRNQKFSKSKSVLKSTKSKTVTSKHVDPKGISNTQIKSSQALKDSSNSKSKGSIPAKTSSKVSSKFLREVFPDEAMISDDSAEETNSENSQSDLNENVENEETSDDDQLSNESKSTYEEVAKLAEKLSRIHGPVASSRSNSVRSVKDMSNLSLSNDKYSLASKKSPSTKSVHSTRSTRESLKDINGFNRVLKHVKVSNVTSSNHQYQEKPDNVTLKISQETIEEVTEDSDEIEQERRPDFPAKTKSSISDRATTETTEELIEESVPSAESDQSVPSKMFEKSATSEKSHSLDRTTSPRLSNGRQRQSKSSSSDTRIKKKRESVDFNAATLSKTQDRSTKSTSSHQSSYTQVDKTSSHLSEKLTQDKSSSTGSITKSSSISSKTNGYSCTCDFQDIPQTETDKTCPPFWSCIKSTRRLPIMKPCIKTSVTPVRRTDCCCCKMTSCEGLSNEEPKKPTLCFNCYTSTSSTTTTDSGTPNSWEKGDGQITKGQVRYAITKITEYGRFTTFEIMKSTRKIPKFIPSTLEGVFVLKHKV